MYPRWCRCRAASPLQRRRCWAMPEKKDERERDVAVNRRAYHDYFIDEKDEAGLVLTGTEAKSMRAGRCNLREVFVRIDRSEASLEHVDVRSDARGAFMD